MGYAEAETIINAPVEAVWACLNDVHQTPEWVSGLAAAELVTTAPYGLGAKGFNLVEGDPFGRPTVLSHFLALGTGIRYQCCWCRVAKSRLLLMMATSTSPRFGMLLNQVGI